MKKLVFLLGAAAALGACNTVSGFGEDVSAGGRVISGASDDVQEQIDGEPEGDEKEADE